MSVNGTQTATNIVTDVNIDTGMGTIGLGTGQDSAVDAMDGSPACFSLNAVVQPMLTTTMVTRLVVTQLHTLTSWRH